MASRKYNPYGRRPTPKPRVKVDAEGKTTVQGTVARIRYETEDRGFQIVVVDLGKQGQVTAVVREAMLTESELVRVTGKLEKSEKFSEWQIEAESVERRVPTTRAGLVAYLSSDAIKGIGGKKAEAIVDHFGRDTLKVLDEQPGRLKEVAGIGGKTAKTIADAWGEATAVRSIMLFLHSQGISSAYAGRIYRTYGAKAIPIVRDNPYRLAQDVRGIGFRLADKIALDNGLKREDPRRLAAGLRYALVTAAKTGHVYLPREELMRHSADLLAVGDNLLDDPLAALLQSGELVVDRVNGADGVYLADMHMLECEIAVEVTRRAREQTPVLSWTEADMTSVQDALGFPLARGQFLALKSVVGPAISVLTGGPGTGKTTIVRAVVLLAQSKKLTVRLCAPTGRAAQRLSESAGEPASTIHRLLEYDPRTNLFTRDADNRLEGDVFIVDESSMLDVKLAAAVLGALPPTSALILVGDVEQLPSVGAGEVLKDIINSGKVEVARLQQIFRQDSDSDIVSCAHAILNGQQPVSAEGKDGQFYFIRAETPDRALALIRKLITDRIPNAFGLHPTRDVQVLVPIHRGDLGTIRINAEIQKAVGRSGPSVRRREIDFHVADKVMQIRNNYDQNVFNGDIGEVRSVNAADRSLVVDFNGQEVEYKEKSLDQLELAYAISVHKSQGSEFPVVILVLANQHYVMLQRNLVYTAVTRARQKLIIVGSDSALRMAVKNVVETDRFTGLAERIRCAAT